MSVLGVFCYLLFFFINWKESFGSNSAFTICESFSKSTGDSNPDQIECNQKLVFVEEIQENKGDKGQKGGQGTKGDVGEPGVVNQTEINQIQTEVEG